MKDMSCLVFVTHMISRAILYVAILCIYIYGYIYRYVFQLDYFYSLCTGKHSNVTPQLSDNSRKPQPQHALGNMQFYVCITI